MKKIILSFIIVFILLIGGYLFYDFKINKKENKGFTTVTFKDLDSFTKKSHLQTIYAKNLNPKSFITLFKEKYNKNTKLNFVTLGGEFPHDWVKPNDVQYLISIMHSKEKCCGYMNMFSSFISTEDAEVGGFAIIFLNSYISQTKINLGLNCNPKTDSHSIKKIEKWYEKQIK